MTQRVAGTWRKASEQQNDDEPKRVPDGYDERLIISALSPTKVRIRYRRGDGKSFDTLALVVCAPEVPRFSMTWPDDGAIAIFRLLEDDAALTETCSDANGLWTSVWERVSVETSQ